MNKLDRDTVNEGISAISTYSVDRHKSPPEIIMPRQFNAAHDLLERNINEGRADKIAYIDDNGSYTFQDLVDRANKTANALTDLGLVMEDRLMIIQTDTVDFPATFLGAIKVGIIPIAVNTLLTSDDYEFMLDDSRAKALIVLSLIHI